MLVRKLLIFALFAGGLATADAAPMRDMGGSTSDDIAPVLTGSFDYIERKSPGWFGGPKTDSAESELSLAENLEKQSKAAKAAGRYNVIVTYWGSSPQAPIAQRRYADILRDRQKMGDAFKAYQYLVRYYAGQFDYDAVLSQQLKIANHMMTERRANFLFFPGFLAPERALPFYEQILANGPTWKRAPEAQFSMGMINEDIGDLDEAILAYDAVMSRFRTHELAASAAFRKAFCLMKLWQKTPRDERSIREAVSAMVSFSVTYPASKDVAVADDYLASMKENLAAMYFDRAEFYELINKNDKAAIIAYREFIRQFPASKLAITAQDRIDKLKSRRGVEK